ncbi:MAG TPA: acetyl-CoA hydrolase/transferase C-terminal domain-containing protein [Candidatus Binataceae bacterium]|nr:acetyl-CoA hydrolase/transferase C-terminal domain-containing protein [Candidatus Binataceae bacterium]
MSAAAATSNGAIRWREQLGERLVEPEVAVSHVLSGDRVGISIAQSTPYTLCMALAARLTEIENVAICHGAPFFSWDLPGLGERFRVESFYLSPLDRPLYQAGSVEFNPIGCFRAHTLPESLDSFNVYMLTVSPPDSEGYVSFGDIQIMSKLMARNAKLVLAEIDERAIRTGGDNSIHLSEIDYFVERMQQPAEIVLPPASPEEARTTATICDLVAHRLVPNRSTLQVGVGSTSGMMMAHLGEHHDLGVQTEIIPWGTAKLVREGVITGKHKHIFPEAVVGSAFAIATPREELEYADGHPGFHLYDFNLTDDARLIAREEGLISINNALSVDLTGQVDSESMGPHMYTGSGGQTAFAVGACMAGGKTIFVLPSSAMVKGERKSRIMPTLPQGSVVTVPRAYVQYVVTEYGIADIRGKTLRQRARELIAIAHPDFRGELTEQARRIWG